LVDTSCLIVVYFTERERERGRVVEFIEKKSITIGRVKKIFEKKVKIKKIGKTHPINALLPRDLGKHSDEPPLRFQSAVAALPASAEKATTFSGSISL